MASPGVANDKITARASDIGEVDAHGAATEFYSLGGRAKGDPDSGVGVDVRADPVVEVPGAQRHPGVQPGAGLPLRRLQGPVARHDRGDLRAVISFLTSEGGKADLRTSAGCRRRRLVSSCASWSTSPPRAPTPSFGLPGTTPPTCSAPHRMGGDWCRCSSCPPCRTDRNSSPPSSCGCSRTSSTTCPRSVTSTSPSWSSSSTRRTCSSTMRAGLPLNQIQQTVRLIRSKGDRHLLRHPVAQGRARGRLGTARQPGPARTARLHPDDAKALRDAIRTYPNTAYDMRSC